MAAPLREIAFEAPDAVRETLAALGRTEDVRLSPSRARLAIACYARETIAIGHIELASTADGPTVALTRLEHVATASLGEPHGLDWRDNETLVVANRAGCVTTLRLADDGRRAVEVSSVEIDSPGSVVVRPLGGDRHEVLVCGNWSNVVTRLELDAGGRLSHGGPALGRRLDLPDGIAASADGRWLAVSNHNTHGVLVFGRETASENAEPVAVLRGVDYPHGLRFAAGDRLLVVADAGAPCAHVFVASTEGWGAVGAAYPTATVGVMDNPTFLRGRRNPAEGGPKGLDVDAETHVVIVTCEELPLAFFDASELFARPERFGADRDSLLRHELTALTEVAEEREAVAIARAELAEVLATRTWRLTAGARRLYGAVRRILRRPSPRAPEAPAISD